MDVTPVLSVSLTLSGDPNFFYQVTLILSRQTPHPHTPSPPLYSSLSVAPYLRTSSTSSLIP